MTIAQDSSLEIMVSTVDEERSSSVTVQDVVDLVEGLAHGYAQERAGVFRGGNKAFAIDRHMDKFNDEVYAKMKAYKSEHYDTADHDVRAKLDLMERRYDFLKSRLTNELHRDKGRMTEVKPIKIIEKPKPGELTFEDFGAKIMELANEYAHRYSFEPGTMGQNGKLDDEFGERIRKYREDNYNKAGDSVKFELDIMEERFKYAKSPLWQEKRAEWVKAREPVAKEEPAQRGFLSRIGKRVVKYSGLGLLGKGIKKALYTDK